MRLKQLFAFFMVSLPLWGQEIIPFDSDRWEISGGGPLIHLGQPALAARQAVLKEVDFSDGIIEFDMAFDGSRGFAGINFHVGSDGHYEHVYLRPHKSGLPDALQYTPVFNGVSSWQLYSGDGYTAPARIAHNQWIHIRLEIKGSQARLFLDNSPRPALLINHLQLGSRSGGISLFGPGRGAACFANFSITPSSDLTFAPPPPADVPAGLITSWELSPVYRLTDVNTDAYPSFDAEAALTVQADINGLVDIARYRAPVIGDVSVIHARCSIEAPDDSPIPISLGYSDWVRIFVNGRPVYEGDNSFRSRSAGFQGIVGRHETLFLPVQEGSNEIMLTVAEFFGGWGFTLQNQAVVSGHAGMKQVWQTATGINMPESALWDARRQQIYISNYGLRAPRGTQFISIHSADGAVENLHWVKGLDRPCGMVQAGDSLYVVERQAVAVIDIRTAVIVRRMPLPGARFPNDIAMDSEGRLYITDSFANLIYRSGESGFEPWLDEPVNNPNGLCCHDNVLVWGDNGENALKIVDLKTGKACSLAELGPGNIDGIQWDRRGFYLVTHFSGRLFQVTPAGRVTELLNTTAAPLNLADFCYIPEKSLFVIPGLFANRLTAFQFDDKILKNGI